MAKVNGFLSELLIADLASVSGLQFKYGDRLTRAEIARVTAWAQASPEIGAAYRDKGHAHHKAVMLYKSMVDHFQSAHALDEAGDPAPWPDRGQRPEATAENPLAMLFPDEAEALHAWAQTNDQYLAAYHDPAHANHANAVTRTQAMLEIASRGESAAAAPTAEGGMPDAAAQARINKLREDPAYLDKTHPGHKAAVEAVTKAYEAAAKSGASLPDGSAPAAKPGAAAPKAPATVTPQQRIAALKDNAAYWNKSDPGHAAAVQEAQAAFGSAYPEPASAPAT